MATKKKKEKPDEKMYTYEEYRRAFCASQEEPEAEALDPAAFGVQLAREALTRVDPVAKRSKGSS